MSILGWIILGLISGFIASKIVNKSGEGFFLDIVLGIVGAIVGGFIFTAFGASGVTGFQHGGSRDWGNRRPGDLPRSGGSTSLLGGRSDRASWQRAGS